MIFFFFFFFFQAEDGIRDLTVTGVQTCALPICGLATPEQARAYIAVVASRLDVDRPGRAWRSLGDTASAQPGYADAPGEWTPIRRARDYYDEMLLVWLDADTLIRETSSGKRSLDDFCGGFFGGPERSPVVRPYSRTDV